MGKKGCLAFLAGLAIWYGITSNYSCRPSAEKRYPLPQEIAVVETNLPYQKRNIERFIVENGKEVKKVSEEKYVKVDEIDFSKDFSIKTERYKFVKDKDWIPSRLIGHVVSLLGKAFFFDWDYGWGQDKERTRAALAMLENDKEVKDITLRLNHNEALSDMCRMFSDDKLADRNNFLARVIMGIPLSLGNELWAEFSRGSYYNPLTRTAVCYSNIEAITAHEIGHHKDFQRFDSDWGYLLARAVPPVMLYQEWKASGHAKNNYLSNDDRWQFNRYLIPAFATYVLGTWGTLKKWFGRKKEDEEIS